VHAQASVDGYEAALSGAAVGAPRQVTLELSASPDTEAASNECGEVVERKPTLGLDIGGATLGLDMLREVGGAERAAGTVRLHGQCVGRHTPGRGQVLHGLVFDLAAPEQSSDVGWKGGERRAQHLDLHAVGGVVACS
jgi:hypothetical protein